MAISEYILSLCDIINDQPDISFGFAVRIGAKDSRFQFETSKVIHSIVNFSPAAESVSVEFLNEFGKVDGLKPLVQPVLMRQTADSPKQWADKVVQYLSVNCNQMQLAKELGGVTDLASQYLSHLLIAGRNPGGKKTPQVSVHPTPDWLRLMTIRNLVDKARTSREQGPLKEALYIRDGYICPFSGYSFDPSAQAAVKSRTAHILPFALHTQPLSLQTIERFTGRAISVNEIVRNINDPSNAFNVQTDCHDYYDDLSWGIEAQVQHDGTSRYIYRKVRSSSAATMRLQDGDEIVFHGGATRSKDLVPLPNPQFCNLKLAIARAMHACAASEIMDQLYGNADDDDEAIMTLPVYLGGPCVSDDALFRRIENRLRDIIL